MRRFAVIVSLLLIPSSAAVAQQLMLPPRADDAIAGSAFMIEVEGLPLAEREQRIWMEIANGNVPDFLRELTPIVVSDEDHTVRLWVAPDYLSIGSDEDFVRIPMTPQLAQRIADLTVCLLPTTRIVDLIWENAEVKLNPQPFSPEIYDITDSRLFLASHWAIEAQRGEHPRGALIAGIKKDVVIAAGLPERPTGVFIYGWHYPTGEPIQPLYGRHVNTWVDYSHGIRLVQSVVFLDNHQSTVEEVLAGPHLCHLLSDEGPITETRYPIQ